MSKNAEWKEKLAEVKKDMEESRLRGTVIKMLRGYGFIRHYPPMAPRRDFFFYKNDLEGVRWGNLEPGDLVSFVPSGNQEEGKSEIALSVRLEQERHLRKDGDGKIFQERR